ncbi:type IV conjugative transfer system protein TraL [Hydrogenovibrio marinus]|uniref:Conjugal transfer protein TraL n=1 Tax=Hydrogenovibrio marinus TaxID=28885 RepID=A0A066ZWM0_HYDMR|nr:type IV conjugative transfer system protein TraL [Hydrogenovibrio marinus]KDN94731.1 hypothetical protein EI16_12610 [Hydrogenovibrio marinus]
MDQDNNGLVPRNLDNLPRFIIWDMWQAMIFLTVFGLGVSLHMLFQGLVLGAVLATAYRRLSAGQIRGFLVHIAYWFTTLGDGYKVIPKSSKRYFQG